MKKENECFLEFLGRIGLIFMIIIVSGNVEDYSIIFRGFAAVAVILWGFLPFHNLNKDPIR